MKKERYELGQMELYHVIANKTQIENNPFLQVVLKDKLDLNKLYESVESALEYFPLFKSTIRYNKQFYLETNNSKIKLICTKEDDRPLEFGDNTQGFLWQICYDEYSFSLEWCHAITDGRGASNFFIRILNNYFGEPVEEESSFPLELGYESIYDKKEKGILGKKQPSCAKANALSFYKRGYKTECHILKVPMEQVLATSKKYKATPTSVLVPIFSKAMRKYIKQVIRNKNVTCNVLIDCRNRMGLNTMHNFIVSKNIAYIDEYDDMDLGHVIKEYRSIIDLAATRENIIKEATDKINTIKILTSIKPRFLQKRICKVVAKVLKHADSNFTFTYLGKMNLSQNVIDGIADVNFRSWTDFGECNIAAVDFNGTLIMNICENYRNKNIISTFIDMCKEEGMEISEVDDFEFEQANLRINQI